MPLPDYTTIVEPLRFPIHGKTYEGYGPSIGDWELILRIEAGTATAEETAGVSLYRLALGDLHEQMVADNVPFEAYKNAALACAAWARTDDRRIAEAVWIHGADQAAVRAALSASQEPAPAAVKAKAPAKPRARKPAAR